MFIELQSGALLNVLWLQDCYVGIHNKNIVIYLFVNGTKYTEIYDSETEAQAQVDKVNTATNSLSLSGGGI